MPIQKLVGWTIVAATLLAVGVGAALAAEPVDKEKAAGPEPEALIKAGFDPSVRPQADLFRYVNGGWIRSTEIPAERALAGSFVDLAEKSEKDLRAIIEDAAKSNAPAGSEARKVGDLFASFMDEARVEELGLSPIKADLDAVAAVKDKAGFLKLLGRLQHEGLGGPFGLFVSTDAKKSDRYVVYLSQGGLSLPDESYYREEKYKPLREAFVGHVARSLELAKVADAKKKAEAILAFETRLAKNHWDRVRSRDRTASYNKYDRKGLEKLVAGLDLAAFLDGFGLKDLDEVIVRQPSYFEALGKAVANEPLDVWKDWLTWQVIRDASPLLSKAFVDEAFSFYGKTLTGAPQNRPRWKRGVAMVGSLLGEAAGKVYVEKHFPPAAKERMKELVKNLTEAYREDIQNLDWMSPATRTKALDKLAKFTPKIGYPDVWRDYSKLEIDPKDLIGNARRASVFETDRMLNKLGKPVDRTEWGMTPQTVNAYYNSGFNEIVFPAAILQPPFFGLDADDAYNYGGIGAVIGHEIGHGFDDQGSKSDGDGNLVNWWTDADRKEFDARAKALIEQYNGFSPAQMPGQHVNGALTIGENIGDLGGLTIAYKAYKMSLKGKEAPVVDGFTGDQRFFIGWAKIWRSKYRDAELSRRLATDPHSPAEFRCNGVVRNLEEFYKAFDVKEGDPLYLPPEKRVRIW